MKFDHIGIVAPKLAIAKTHLTGILGITNWTEEFVDPVNKVYVQFGHDASGVCYETIAPLSDDSPVTQALKTSNRILNHVAYLVEHLDVAASAMTARHCFPVGPPNPAVAYDGNRIQFFVTPLKFIVELIEAPGHQHAYHAHVP